MSTGQKRRPGLPAWATILAWLGIIGTILGVITGIISLIQFGQQAISGPPTSSADQQHVYETLAAVQVANAQLGVQLTQYALAGQQSANDATAKANNALVANVQGTMGALQAQQDALIATANANSALEAASQAAAATATQTYLDAGATNAALSQIAPTATELPTSTPVPAPVADYRSLTGAAIQLQPDGRISFSVQTAQDIPAAPPTGVAYVWMLDTDHNPTTGLPVQDIGVDMKVTVRFANGAWLGSVRAVLVDGSEGSELVFTDIQTAANGLSATLDPAQFALQASFDWVAQSQSDQETYPLLPATSHFTLQ